MFQIAVYGSLTKMAWESHANQDLRYSNFLSTCLLFQELQQQLLVAFELWFECLGFQKFKWLLFNFSAFYSQGTSNASQNMDKELTRVDIDTNLLKGFLDIFFLLKRAVTDAWCFSSVGINVIKLLVWT